MTLKCMCVFLLFPLCFFSFFFKNNSVTPYILFDKDNSVTPYVLKKTTVLPLMFFFMTPNKKKKALPLMFFYDDR